MEVEDEYEETVEEMCLLMEFAGNTGDDALKQDNLTLKVIGIDSDQPLVQIGNLLYAGEYCDTFGTELIFSEVENNCQVDPVFENKLDHKLVYLDKTNKKLVIKRAFATVKSAGGNKGDTSSGARAQPSKE